MSVTIVLLMIVALALVGSGAMLIMGSTMYLALAGYGDVPVFPTTRLAALGLWLGALLFVAGAALGVRGMA